MRQTRKFKFPWQIIGGLVFSGQVTSNGRGAIMDMRLKTGCSGWGIAVDKRSYLTVGREGLGGHNEHVATMNMWPSQADGITSVCS